MAQTVTLTAMAGGVLLACCAGVFLMLKSRRPEPKMIFLMGLLNDAADSERDRELGGLDGPRSG